MKKSMKLFLSLWGLALIFNGCGDGKDDVDSQPGEWDTENQVRFDGDFTVYGAANMTISGNSISESEAMTKNIPDIGNVSVTFTFTGTK